MAKIPPADTTAGSSARAALARTVGKAASADHLATAKTLESLRRAAAARRESSASSRRPTASGDSQGTSPSSSKPSQYGGGQETARQQTRERLATRRGGGSPADDALREEFDRVQEGIQEEIEERQDILDDSGGSSDSTIVVGDDADEEVRAIGAYNVYYKVNSAAISGGYIQFISLGVIALNDDPTNASELQYIQDNKTNRGFIMYRTIRFTVGTDTSSLEDFYFLTDMPTPSLSTSLNKYFYSQEEKEFLKSRLKTGARLNLVGLTAAVESFFQIDEAGRFEGSIITNRIESTKKLKLTSLPSDTPVTSTTESTTSPGSSY